MKNFYLECADKVVDLYFKGVPALDAIEATKDWVLWQRKKRADKLRAINEGLKKDRDINAYMHDAWKRRQKEPLNLGKLRGDRNGRS
jgi:hypothetical protein